MMGIIPAWFTRIGRKDCSAFAPLRRPAYVTGMRRWPSVNRTTTRVRINVIRRIATNGSRRSGSLEASFKVGPAILGTAARMLARIMIEIPFPIPFSVIISPSHMSTTVPADTINMIGRITVGSVMSEMIGTCACALISAIIPYDCRNASGKVSQRVYLLIFCLPCWPSFEISSIRGTITVKSCMMIEALMYGESPISTMEKFSALPPVNMLKAPSNAFWSNTCCSAARSTPGIVIWVMSL